MQIQGANWYPLILNIVEFIIFLPFPPFLSLEIIHIKYDIAAIVPPTDYKEKGSWYLNGFSWAPRQLNIWEEIFTISSGEMITEETMRGKWKSFCSPHPSPRPDCLYNSPPKSSLIYAHPQIGHLLALLPQQAHVNINTYCAAGGKKYCSLSCTKAASTRRVTSHGATSQDVIRIACTSHLKDCAEIGQCNGQNPLPSLNWAKTISYYRLSKGDGCVFKTIYSTRECRLGGKSGACLS